VPDRVVGASTDWTARTPDRLAVTVAAADGTRLELEATLKRSAGTRLLEAAARVTPRAVQRSRLGGAVSSAALDRLLGANGTGLVGRTETGARY
jgi:hypothetical protein